MPADNTHIPHWLSPRTAKWLLPLLLILGVQCWLVLGQGNYGHFDKLAAISLAIFLGLIPPVNRALSRCWNSLAHPTPALRRCIALLTWIGSSLLIYWTEIFQHARFKPMFADEFSYLIQMHMLARGRLWMPALPLPRFFDSFYILVTPAYASMYFPGMAMMYFPSLLLHLPYTVFTLAAGGLCAAMFYLVLCEALDGALAILGVILLLSLSLFRLMSIMLLAQIPMLLLGLLMTLALLKWRRDMRRRWLLLLGAAAGWAAITRPADALAFAIVLAIILAIDLRRKPAKLWIAAAACIAAPAIPFLMLQLILNHQVTGDWLTTPFARYNDVNYPGAFGFHDASPPAHVSDVPEVQRFYEMNVKPLIEQHRLSNVPSLLLDEFELIRRTAIVDPLLFLIAPISLLAIWDRRLWAVWGMLPVFPLLLVYSAFSADLEHYFVMVMPAVILLCLAPIRFLSDIFPCRAAMIRAVMAMPMIVIALAAMPQLNRLVRDQYPATPELDQIDRNLAENISPPAVVLFHSSKNSSVAEEPVFNADVAWPDDAPIIRARDLNPKISAVGGPGDLDRPLYEYYSRISPGRVFYLYSRGGGSDRLKRLGTGPELLQGTPHPPN